MRVPVPTVVCVGVLCTDMTVEVPEFPLPDSKVRTQASLTAGGGNAGNTATALRRLGGNGGERIHIRLVSAVGTDARGTELVQELEAEGVDVTDVSRIQGSTSFTYVIVDAKEKTRTCIHTPGTHAPLDAATADLPRLLALLEGGGCGLLHVDTRLMGLEVHLARVANDLGVAVSVDVEKYRQGLEGLLPCCDYIFTSEHFPAAHTGKGGEGERGGSVKRSTEEILGEAQREMLDMYPRCRCIVSTRGDRGCAVTVRRGADGEDCCLTEEEKIILGPMECSMWTSAGGAASQGGRRGEGPRGRYTTNMVSAWPVEQDAVVDTTGAGDAFIGGCIWEMVVGGGVGGGGGVVEMVAMGAKVAACKIQSHGARAGLPTLGVVGGMVFGGVGAEG